MFVFANASFTIAFIEGLNMNKMSYRFWLFISALSSSIDFLSSSGVFSPFLKRRLSAAIRRFSYNVSRSLRIFSREASSFFLSSSESFSIFTPPIDLRIFFIGFASFVTTTLLFLTFRSAFSFFRFSARIFFSSSCFLLSTGFVFFTDNVVLL